ncbi:transglycosylase SLT domain-containing protein [Litorilituus sediminis]|uniref:Lytic murein transglycosylase n=1 Tax=Litorilituus sediminis TaxID=718192 RepID=A0A4P6P5M1_9GAMM|nr:transglycosylase SLT domain-containing protein [Litorilituus sediminis]QBG36288.1 lytic murein transglycosylase [Litorilituus sediminis]
MQVNRRLRGFADKLLYCWHKVKAILLLSALSLAFFKPGFASQPLAVTTDKNQQQLFLKAERLTSQSQSRQYIDYYNQLHYYPLQPYLDQRRLMDKMKLSDATEIKAFLTKYEDSPLDWPLRKAWLKFLAKKNQPLLFMQFFKPTSNVLLTCQHLKYALKTGSKEADILPQVTPLWLVGKSQDKACDPLFERWQKSGYRTDDVVWQRVELAADGGKHTLIPYLTKLLPKEQQYLASLWHKVRRDPAIVSRLKYFPNKSAKEAQIFTYGIKRLVWRDPNRAIKTYKKALKVFPLTDEQNQQITEKFALALANKNHKAARTWLDKLQPAQLNENMLQWRITELLKEQDWHRVIKELKQLPESQQQDLQWQYWYARALIATDQLSQGKQIMDNLADKRHYYGFLAASYLQAPVSLQHKPVNITLAEKQQVLAHPSAKRAFELFYLKRFTQARREWNFWLSKLSNKEKLVAAKVANENNWFDRAIFTLSQVGYLDDVELRFPKAFDKKINHHANNQQINPAWAFAITRRESSFMTDAYSSAGARGLMQLMPNTAKNLKRGKVNKKYLLNAENNIQLGTKYLRQLLDKNEGNQVLATAAYNAGPYRVKRWLKNVKALPADIWIETIPFKETRNYVKSVLAYQEIYQHKPGQVSSVFDTVINMNIGD